jgi:formylglycine-generating enzyme required for sulfatase activity
LPTEAEWEYACRAGTVSSRYYGGSIALLKEYAWYVASSRDRAWPCGLLQPNELGLFDMLGNVYEWCQDQSIQNRTARDGTIEDDIIAAQVCTDKTYHTIRGASFPNRAAIVRAANRDGLAPSLRTNYVGFRLARTLP